MQLNIPETALVNKLIPTETFIEKNDISDKVQKEFIRRIKRIKWLYRLSEETIGIPKTSRVSEVQVIEIELNQRIIPEKILHVVDGLMNFQIVYLFKYKNDHAWGIALKRKGSTEGYYFSKWNSSMELPFQGVNIENLYRNLVLAFIPERFYCSECFQVIELYNRILEINRDIEEISKKLCRETDAIKTSQLNRQLLRKKAELQAISERHRKSD